MRVYSKCGRWPTDGVRLPWAYNQAEQRSATKRKVHQHRFTWIAARMNPCTYIWYIINVFHGKLQKWWRKTLCCALFLWLCLGSVQYCLGGANEWRHFGLIDMRTVKRKLPSIYWFSLRAWIMSISFITNSSSGPSGRNLGLCIAPLCPPPIRPWNGPSSTLNF